MGITEAITEAIAETSDSQASCHNSLVFCQSVHCESVCVVVPTKYILLFPSPYDASSPLQSESCFGYRSRRKVPRSSARAVLNLGVGQPIHHIRSTPLDQVGEAQVARGCGAASCVFALHRACSVRSLLPQLWPRLPRRSTDRASCRQKTRGSSCLTFLSRPQWPLVLTADYSVKKL